MVCEPTELNEVPPTRAADIEVSLSDVVVPVAIAIVEDVFRLSFEFVFV